ncbi:DUF3320 domain-containing protein [Acidobacteria bacterium AH-259-D05]|nr:DUF3320 domain-containing protein [Acidobacteria bacterium AH-259-D05]
MDEVRKRLETARQDLLDLSLRNTLINFRMLKSKGLEIIDELPIEIYRHLVQEERAMSFLPAKEETSGQPSEEKLLFLIDQPDEDDSKTAARHRDDKLQTPYTSVQLQRRLLNTYRAARSSIEEQGVNTLYLALGLLNWYEAEASSLERKAPLILIPVELYRTDVQSRFRLRFTGEEIGKNLSLQAKLKQEFGIDLPNVLEDEDIDVQAYLNSVAESVRSMESWSVDLEAISLGFFSFSKFLMYKDLDCETWPEDVCPTDNDIIKALLGEGFREEPPHLNENDYLDEHISPGEIQTVVDADSSQMLAIVAAREGRNLVIQGPPGTGKSQTITNLIAQAISESKTVLFVAEKMAALEVVKRRLDNVGIGTACLELHSNKTVKKILLNELRRTIELGQPILDDFDEKLAALEKSQNRLNEYCAAIKTPVGETRTSPYEAIGRLVKLVDQLKEVDAPAFDNLDVSKWDKKKYGECVLVAEDLQNLLKRIGVPSRHIFGGCQLKTFLPTDKTKTERSLSTSLKVGLHLRESSNALADLIGIKQANDKNKTKKLVDTAQRAVEAPDLTGISVHKKDWLDRRSEIQSALEAGHKLKRLYDTYDRLFLPEAWEQDVFSLRQTLAVYASRWWRFLSGDYRMASRVVEGLCREMPPKGVKKRLAVVEAILESQRCKRVFKESEKWLSSLFGERWAGVESDWPFLMTVLSWLELVHKDIQADVLEEELLSYLASEPQKETLSEKKVAVKENLIAHGAILTQLLNLLAIDESVRFRGQSLADLPYSEQETVLNDWSTNLDHIQDIITFNHLSDRMTKEGLEPVIIAAIDWDGASQFLVHLLKQVWYSWVLERAIEERDALAQFDGATHTGIAERFRELDVELTEHNRARLALKHWEDLPDHSTAGQLGVLRREFEKKRRHLPIRKLMQEAGNAVQAIKPVFMMSPLSIATYIPPGSLTFDLVIFDEASQVRPTDSFGAIVRGKQVIVVGDSRQLPPTQFFDRVVEAEDEEDEEESVTSDLESVLGLFCAQGAYQRMLRWHYRSRHESLITVSNNEFYDNKLVVFPSPDAEKRDVGLVFRHLPETAYLHGRGRRYNVGEAKDVATCVMDHARENPGLSLGVAAFSHAQAQVIQDQLEFQRRQDPSCEPFFNDHPEEPFFVKNLENVQGDERDVIYISIGYGKREDGIFSMNLGPLNNVGGERRLNVLITRARNRCEVFSNITANDIDLNRTKALGVVALKTFLKYAETGILDVPSASGRAADSPFEEAVADELRKLGYTVDHQVGSAGFFIDLAIVNEKSRGNYLLGIECDGASYHSARSARDRDRLRQQVLEGLGWEIHRIWSTDWFKNSDRELRRVVESIEVAKTRHLTVNKQTVRPQEIASRNSDIERREDETKGRDNIRAELYHTANISVDTGHYELHQVPFPIIAGWIEQVVNDESPVHIEEVARRITAATGLKRTGRRIRQAIEDTVNSAASNNRFRQKNNFLWRNDMEQPEVRDRSNLPAISRDIEMIAPEEVARALQVVVTASLGIEPKSGVEEACRLFGLKRVTQKTAKVVETVLSQMIERGEFRTKHNLVFTQVK